MKSRTLTYIGNMFRSTLTLLSPVLNTKVVYLVKKRRRINLEAPETFSEKLQWLKLNDYNTNPLVAKCADKYRVREYIAEQGCEDSLNTLIDAFDTVDELCWNNLPQRFALKWNFGAGFNIICKDKGKLDEQQTLKQLKSWRLKKPWLGYAELQYKHIQPKLLLEEFLDSENDAPIPDYKLYCFHGEPKAILVMHDRGVDMKADFFDLKWNKIDGLNKYADLPIDLSPPITLAKMIDYSRKLSQPFPFVRVDFYEVTGKLYFGELTFTPSAGFDMSETEVDGKPMGELIKLKT